MPRKSAIVAFAVVLVGCLTQISALTPSKAENTVSAKKSRFLARSRNHDGINDNVVTILSGNRDGDSLGIVYDLSEVLDDGDNLRVLPAVGRGSAQNVRDVLRLRGIDMGIAHSNLLNHFAKTGELGDVRNRVTYVTKLFNEEMHVIAGPDIKDLNDLRDKSVNFGEVGSGTQLTGRLVFQALGLQIKEANMEQHSALDAIKEGRLAATILITSKPSKVITELRSSDGFRLIPIAFTAPLVSDYYPATLDHADYPNLIADGARVDTIANCAVIIAFNWPKGTERYRKVARFVDALFDHFDDFRKAPRGPKWREVNFAATLEGWTRFPAAQYWLDNARLAEADKNRFQTFVQSNGSSDASNAQREELFREYMKWKKTKGQD